MLFHDCCLDYCLRPTITYLVFCGGQVYDAAVAGSTADDIAAELMGLMTSDAVRHSHICDLADRLPVCIVQTCAIYSTDHTCVFSMWDR